MRTWFKIFLLGKWQCHYDMYFRIWKTDIDLCQVIWNPFFNDVTWRTGSRSLFGLIQNLRYQEEVGTEWSTKYHFFQPILGLSINYVVSVGGGVKNCRFYRIKRRQFWDGIVYGRPHLWMTTLTDFSCPSQHDRGMKILMLSD